MTYNKADIIQVKISKAVLYSDWLYFQRHGTGCINLKSIYTSSKSFVEFSSSSWKMYLNVLPIGSPAKLTRSW